MEPSIRLACPRLFPANASISMLIWAGFSGLIGLASVVLGTTILRDYSLALFFGVPLVMGVVGPLYHGMGARRDFVELLLVSFLGQCVLFTALLVLGLEGLGCMIMCAPLWMCAAVIGSLIAYPVHLAMWNDGSGPGRGFPLYGLLLIAALPVWMGAEPAVRAPAPVWQASATVDIDAPPEVVWRYVIAFPPLPPPDDLVFKMGVAYPMHATISGEGVGAMRHCVFSTGAFVEPITRWEEGELLAFDVTENPPSMQELSPYHIHPPHLTGFMNSQRGQFELIDLGNGKTRLIGTTWYQNQIHPTAYWQWWSDAIIHRIHLRVLNHVKQLSEAEVRG